jgi:hypothetical protein
MKKITTFLYFVILSHIIYSQEKVDYLIQNVSIAPMNKEMVLENQDVAIRDGKIIAIVDSNTKNYQAEKTIDGTGKFILPTLGDAHVHLPKKEEELEKYFILNLINGVTKLRSMRGKWEHFNWIHDYDSLHTVSPKIYLSPPPIYRNFDLTTEQLTKYIEAAKKYGSSHIKLMSVKDEALFKELNRICEENNMPIAGHFPSNLQGNLIFNSQINSLEHLGGLVGVEESVLKQRINAIKKNNIFIDPTLSWYVIGYGQYSIPYMKNQRGMEYVAPKTVAEWTAGTKKYREELGKEAYKSEVKTYSKELEERYRIIKRLNDLGIKLLISPDASSNWVVPGFGMLEEMKLYKKASLTNYDILKTATVNFAAYFNEENYGTIEVGKNADFIMLEENPLKDLGALKNIEGIFFDNQYLDKAQLEKMASQILPVENKG